MKRVTRGYEIKKKSFAMKALGIVVPFLIVGSFSTPLVT